MRLIRYAYPTQRRYVPASVFARSPWSGFESEVDRLFDAVFVDGRGTSGGRFPVDFYEDKANTYVRAELPGVDRDAIRVEVVDGQLDIQASRKLSEGGDEATATFRRTLGLPEDVQADKVSARYENGVLTVTLPKNEVVEPKKITVPVK